MRTTNPAMIVMAVLTLASIIPAMAQLSYTLPKKVRKGLMPIALRYSNDARNNCRPYHAVVMVT